MNTHLPQFVPQEVCLRCDGCCRFKDEQSPWRPKVAQSEISPESVFRPHLAEKIFSSPAQSSGFYLKALTVDGQCQCSHFDASDNTCGLYAHRPFECQLYPFLLAKKDDKLYLAVHLLCPHIQENKPGGEFDRHVKKLQQALLKEPFKSFIHSNPFLAGGYEDYQEELEYLFCLEES